jgi:hypothetical protein
VNIEILAPIMQSKIEIQVLSLCPVTLNCILFMLTLKHSPKQMAAYSKIIRLHCVMDVLTCVKILVSLNVSFLR